MKIHIENLNITLSNQQPPAGLIAELAIARVSNPVQQAYIPAIGEKWPGLEAVYAGKALSQNEDRLIHLILWLEDAEAASAGLRAYLIQLAYVREFGGDWVPDWNDFDQLKWYLFFDYKLRKWSKSCNASARKPNTVYMSEECADGLVEKLNSGEVEL